MCTEETFKKVELLDRFKISNVILSIQSNVQFLKLEIKDPTLKNIAHFTIFFCLYIRRHAKTLEG